MQHLSASGKWASCVFWTSPAATNVILKKENQSITIKSLQFYENGEQITNKSHQDFYWYDMFWVFSYSHVL